MKYKGFKIGLPEMIPSCFTFFSWAFDTNRIMFITNDKLLLNCKTTRYWIIVLNVYCYVIVHLNTLYRFFTIVHARLSSIRKYYKDLFVKYKKNIRLVFLVTFHATNLFNISMGVSLRFLRKSR